MSEPLLISQKEAAALLGISTAMMRDNEDAWGLKRVNVRTRTVLYRRVDIVRFAELSTRAAAYRRDAVGRTGTQ